VSEVDEAYGKVFAPVAVEVMMPEKPAVPNCAPPTALNCPVTVEEAVTRELLAVTRPVLLMRKRVEVEKMPPELVVEEMLKRTGLVVEALFSRAKVANGEEVPRPRLPVVELKVNCPATAALPNCTVA
jgi:hypothetical protein